MLASGDRVGGYEIVAPLRAGGMAAFYVARRVGPAGFVRPVGIKVIHGHLATDRAFVEMFLDEARLSARIVHPNVVHVEELGESDGAYFLAMEFVHGAPLSSLLRRLSETRRALTPEVACAIAMKVADGLHAAHEATDDAGARLEVVHRDVSPQNVLVGADGRVKLIDFGIARARGRLQETDGAGALKGKLRYMAPEQAWGKPIDRRADVYALGIVLWEMLTGRRLFGGQDDIEALERVRAPIVPPPSELAPTVSPAIDEVVRTALAVSLEERFDTAQAFRRALGNACPGALRVEPDELGGLVRATMADELEKERQLLTTFQGAVVPTREDDLTMAERATLETREIAIDEPAAKIAPTRIVPAPARRSALPAFGFGALALIGIAGIALYVYAGRAPMPGPVPAAAAAPAPIGPGACESIAHVVGVDGQTMTQPFDTRGGTLAFELDGMRNPAFDGMPSSVVEYVVPGAGARSVDVSTNVTGTAADFDTILGVYRGACRASMADDVPDESFDDVGMHEYRAAGVVRAQGGDVLTIVISGYGGAVRGRHDEGDGTLSLRAWQTRPPVLDTARVSLGGTEVHVDVEGSDADGDANAVRLRFEAREGSPITTVPLHERIPHGEGFAASGVLDVGVEGIAAFGAASDVEVALLDQEGNASAPLVIDVTQTTP